MIDQFRGRWYFLSNFYPCEIEHKGIIYPSVEHYYVAMKVRGTQHYSNQYFTESDFRELISKVKLAADVKKIGQTLKCREDWDSVRLDVMKWGVNEKFTKHEDLKNMLKSTEPHEIVEGNWWHDNFYGQCTCPKCFGKGENNLGKILMEIRSRI